MSDELRVYFKDDSELAEAGATTSLADAQTIVAVMADRAKSASDIATAVNDRLTSMQRGNSALRTRRADQRTEHAKATVREFEGAILGQDNMDHGPVAGQYTSRTATINWLTAAIAHFEGVTLPILRLEHWRADARMLRETGGLVMSQALVAAIKRHAAIENLIEVDGSATIAAAGKAHDLLVQGLEYYRRAAENDAAADVEEKRQQTLEVLQ